MLNEATANSVMTAISVLEDAVYHDYDIDCFSKETAAAVLDHLYEMHKLRDLDVWSSVFSLVEFGDPIENLMWELQPDA